MAISMNGRAQSPASQRRIQTERAADRTSLLVADGCQHTARKRKTLDARPTIQNELSTPCIRGHRDGRRTVRAVGGNRNWVFKSLSAQGGQPVVEAPLQLRQ